MVSSGSSRPRQVVRQAKIRGFPWVILGGQPSPSLGRDRSPQPKLKLGSRSGSAGSADRPACRVSAARPGCPCGRFRSQISSAGQPCRICPSCRSPFPAVRAFPPGRGAGRARHHPYEFGRERIGNGRGVWRPSVRTDGGRGRWRNLRDTPQRPARRSTPTRKMKTAARAKRSTTTTLSNVASQ